MFIDQANDIPSFSLRIMNRLEAKPLAGTENSYEPAFSPDGQSIAFVSYLNGPKIKKITATGGPAITLCDAPGAPRTVAWGDDGKIVFGSGKGLMRVSDSGGTPEALTSVDPNGLGYDRLRNGDFDFAIDRRVKQVQSFATATQRRNEFVCIQSDPTHLSPAPYFPDCGDRI